MDTTKTPTPPAATTQVCARLFAACAMFRATKDIRYYLGCVYVRPNPLGHGVLLCATDGLQMLVAFDEAGHTDKDFIFHCSAGLVAAARKAISGTVRVSEGLTRVHDEHGGELFIQPGRPDIEGKFPDFSRILPASHELGEPDLLEPIAANLQQRIAAAAAFLKTKKGAGAISHWSYGSHRPVLSRIDAAPELVIATMGMRDVAADAAMPAGLRGPVDYLKQLAATVAAQPASGEDESADASVAMEGALA